MLEALDAVFRDKAPPRDMLTFSRSLRLPADGGPHAGENYDPDTHPAHLEILRGFMADEFGQVVAVGPTQDGKTWVNDVIPMLYALIERGESVAVVMPTRSKLNSLWQTKVLPAIRGNDFGHLLPAQGHGSEGATPEEIALGSGGHAHLLSTGTSNEAGLSNITVRWVFGDEVDDITPARRLDLAWARADAWGLEARRAESSTIKHDAPGASRVLRDYQAGTASRLWFACPHCGRWQTWEWERVTYDPTNDATARDSVRLACQNGCLLTEADRRRSLYRHRLVHRDQLVADDGAIVGGCPLTRVFSLRWTALDSPLKTLGELAVRHRTATAARDANGDHDKLIQFFRDQLACQYVRDAVTDEGEAKLSAAYLAARSHAHGWAVQVPVKDRHGQYSRHLADLPAQARRTVATIDVQGNRLYWYLGAEDDQRCTYDVAWGYEFSTGAKEPLTEITLQDVLDRVSALVDDLAGHTVTVYRAVDVGYHLDWILPWLARNPSWVPLAGSSDDTLEGARRAAQLSIPGVVHLYRPAKSWDCDRLLHAVDVRRVRERAQNRYLVPAGKPGGAYLPRGVQPGDLLARHLVAEELVQSEKTGEKVWRKAKGGGRWDLLDLRTYADALFDLARHTADHQAAQPKTQDLASVMPADTYRNARRW